MVGENIELKSSFELIIVFFFSHKTNISNFIVNDMVVDSITMKKSESKNEFTSLSLINFFQKEKRRTFTTCSFEESSNITWYQVCIRLLLKWDSIWYYFRAKLYNKRRQNEKIQMKKTIKSHEEKETKQRQEVPEGAVPAYLLDREKQSRAKILSNTIKQKRKEKAVEFFVIFLVNFRHERVFSRANGMCRYRKSKQWVKPKSFVLFNLENDEVSEWISRNQWSRIVYRESMETFGNKTLLCRWRFHPKTTKIRTIYSTHGERDWGILFFSNLILFLLGTSIHQSTRHTSRIESHFSVTNHWREEKSKFTSVHILGCYHQRNSTRSKFN